MKTQKKYTLGIIGLGHMGSAIARGAVKNDYIERYEIGVYDPSEHARKDSNLEGFDPGTFNLFYNVANWTFAE